MAMNECRWCGLIHGPQCPTVKAIEFFEDGCTVKRVEFYTPNDYPPLTAGFASLPATRPIYGELR